MTPMCVLYAQNTLVKQPVVAWIGLRPLMQHIFKIVHRKANLLSPYRRLLESLRGKVSLKS